QERPTVELNAFRLPTVTVLAPFAPWAMVRLPGEACRLKSGGGGGTVTVSERAALCVNAPLVPTTETAYVPAVVAAATDTVSVLVAVPPAGGVTGVGSKAHAAP